MRVEIKAGTNNIHPSSVKRHLSLIWVTGGFWSLSSAGAQAVNLRLQATSEIHLVGRNLAYAEKTTQAHEELWEWNPEQACSQVPGPSFRATQ